ncbi:MAG TPA: hypothetical protein VGA70_01485 [Longimicrobiales bacterium]|jgi:hypothetical protein
MADRTLLVPGTQATNLADQNGKIVYNAVRVSVGLQKDDLGGRPPSEWQALLSTEHRPGLWAPTKTSLEPGTEVTEHSVVGTPYDRMLSFAEPWPYDWRLDMRYNALKLLRYLERNAPQEGRWNLIAHSQGGIIIVLASKLASRVDDFAHLVGRVVLVGAPLAGTMRATEAILWGSTGLGADQVDAARGMARTWPALYQMMPSWRAVLDKDGNEAPDDQQLVQPGGWPGAWGTGIQDDLLLRTREVQALLHGPMSNFGPSMLARAVLGKKQMSPVTLVRNGNDLPADRNQMASQLGDSLVPAQRTLDWGGTMYANHVLLLTGKPERHAMLCQDEDVVATTKKFLKQKTPPAPASA